MFNLFIIVLYKGYILKSEFGANDLIRREDSAVILQRVMTVLNAKPGTVETVTFNDQQLISNYAVTAVKTLQQSGIILGKTNGNYDPSGLTTKAEAATMIYRLLLQQSAE